MTRNLHISLTAFRNESRLLRETKALVELGFAEEVCIVALHEKELTEYEQLDPARDVVRIKLRTRTWPRNIASQICKYVEFSWRAIAIGRARRSNMYNIHSVGLLPLGVLLKLICGGKLVYDAHELETEAEGLRGFRKRAAKCLEQTLIRFADLIIVVSPGIENWYRKRYPHSNIVTILNVPRFRSSSHSTALRDALSIPDQQRIVLYQGGLSTNRGIEELIAAATALDRAGYALVFMGYGPLHADIEYAANQHPNVHLHPSVPPAEVIRYTASADVGVTSIADSCLSYRLCLPNKLFEYIMAGLPVIASKLPELENVMKETGVGVCLDAWTPEALVSALSEIEHMRGPELDARLEVAAKKYSWEAQMHKLEKAYSNYVIPRA